MHSANPKGSRSLSNSGFRTPTKTSNKSKQKLLNSHQILTNQGYVNVMNRLLRLNTLKQFIREGSRYVSFEDQEVAHYRPKEEYVRRSLKYTQSLGYVLMRDGGFLKHYALLLQIEAQDKKSLRQKIYSKYKQKIQVRKDMFLKHFAKQKHLELKMKQKAQQQKRNKSKSKSKSKAKINPNSGSKSIKKQSLSEITPLKSAKKLQENSKLKSNHKSKEKSKLKQNIFKMSNCKNTSLNSLQKQNSNFVSQKEEQNQQTYQQALPPISYEKKGQTQEQKEQRLAGFCSSKKSNKRPNKVYTFNQYYNNDPQVNSKLQKWREVITSWKKTQTNAKQVQKRKSCIDPQLILQPAVKQLNSEELSQSVLEIIQNYFPNLDKTCFKKQVQIYAGPRYIGTFKQLICQKFIIKDRKDLYQQIYTAVMVRDRRQQDQDLHQQSVQINEAVSVLLK